MCCNFQGERNEGYSVLYSNMKNGTTAAKELADMLRELAKVRLRQSVKSKISDCLFMFRSKTTQPRPTSRS